MRKTIFILAVAFGAAVSTAAQPKAVGGRVGVTGLEISYQHNFRKADFLEASAGLDFGYNASGAAGFKATGIYNFMFARPAWTEKGAWGIYAGPGVSLGYVNDRVRQKIGGTTYQFANNGFMLSLVAQIGMEYTFWFPLQLSVDLRPMFGMHVNDKVFTTPGNNGIQIEKLDSRVGYYDNGWLGFAPTVSIRYRF